MLKMRAYGTVRVTRYGACGKILYRDDKGHPERSQRCCEANDQIGYHLILVWLCSHIQIFHILIARKHRRVPPPSSLSASWPA